MRPRCLLLSVALVSLLAGTARADMVRIRINGTVAVNDVCIFPGSGPGTAANISFLASSNGSGGYSLLDGTMTVGSTTYGLTANFTVTNGGTDRLRLTWALLTGSGLSNYMTMSLSDTTGTALQSQVLGDSLGTSTLWMGGWHMIVGDYGLVVFDADVTSVTISDLINNRWVGGPAGDDANGGTSPADAYATISHAASQSFAGDTIHVLPGTYDAARGESFPITLNNDVDLIGEEGPAKAIIDGNGASIALRIASSDAPIVCGLRFTDCGTGISIEGANGHRLQNLSIDNCGVGIDIDVVGHRGGLVSIENSRFEACGVGISSINDTSMTVRTNRSLFRGCGTGYENFSPFGVFSAHIILQSLFLLNDVALDGNDFAIITVRDTLAVQNTDAFVSSAIATRIERSTIADNSGFGVFGVTTVEGSIITGNGANVTASLNITNSNIGSPGFAGSGGNISVNPLFKNPTGFDYRLSYGSACVDTAPPTIDFDGAQRQRMVDGDLDGEPGRDMGAFELRTLELAGVPVIGTTVPLELNGPPGSYGVLFASSLLLDPPLFTPLGLWWLPQNQMIPLARVHFSASGTAITGFSIPNLPAYVGTELYLQGIMRSSESPVGIAATDLVTLVVQP